LDPTSISKSYNTRNSLVLRTLATLLLVVSPKNSKTRGCVEILNIQSLETLLLASSSGNSYIIFNIKNLSIMSMQYSSVGSITP
jgi:hypothetical protein